MDIQTEMCPVPISTGPDGFEYGMHQWVLVEWINHVDANQPLGICYWACPCGAFKETVWERDGV